MDPFPVSQGVHQGSVLSTDLCKLYINPLLNQIEDSGIGMQIGTIPCSAPTCADDVSLIADSEKNLQILIEFKAQLKFRFQVRPLGFNSVIATTVGLLDIHM